MLNLNQHHNLTQYLKSKFQPTANQISAVQAIEEFLNSSKKCFILKGYAGTGKTTITKYITNYLQEQNKSVVLMAPTGRASRILSSKTKHKASTIHKSIYNLDHVDEFEITKGGKKQYKFRFNLRQKDANIETTYMIDEASMISDVYSEDDFFIFGSGHLLSDIITFISPQNEARKDKIIFIGDPAQLPPVTDNISGALNTEYLWKKFRLETAEFELTEVVRQQQTSGILSNATYLRNQLQNSGRNSFGLNLNFPDVKRIPPEEVVSTFVKENPTLLLEKCVIINYSNKSALEYNMAVREKLFPDKMQIAVNDTLIINQNNYNYAIELLNGMLVKVVEVSPTPLIKSNMLAYNATGNEVRVTHQFRRIKIAVDEDQNSHIIDCMILENFLYSPSPSLAYTENIALYLDFKIRHQHLKPKSQPFSDALRKDPFFNALRVKYGYAITCHKAQGGEWEKPIVNLNHNQGRLSDNFLRWTYTAITRASAFLYLFNTPRINKFTTLKFIPQKIEEKPAKEVTVEDIVFNVPDNLLELYAALDLSNSEKFQKDKFIEILAIATSNNLEIVSRRHTQYQEFYLFTKDGKSAELIFYYNGKNQFTKILPSGKHNGDKEFTADLLKVFEKQYNIQIVNKKCFPKPLIEEQADFENTDTIKFSEENKDLKDLFDELSSLLRDKLIRISNIEHNSYQEVYSFERNHEKAAIIFYYDSLSHFTHCTPLAKRCNSHALLADLQTAINVLSSL